MKAKEKLIMLIEDSENITECLELLLSAKGFKLVKTRTILDIENLIYKHSPDLILMDMLLSNSNGCDGCKTIKANCDMEHVPIIMTSAHPNGAIESKAAGADAFIEKPFDFSELITLIQSSLKRNFNFK